MGPVLVYEKEISARRLAGPEVVFGPSSPIMVGLTAGDY